MSWRRALLGWAWVIALAALTAAIVAVILDDGRHGLAITWRHPWAMALAASGLLVGWVGFHLRATRAGRLGFSRAAELARHPRGWVERLVQVPTALRVVALVVLALALARPVTFRTVTRQLDSVDIMLVFDLSRSMEETDLPRDRLDAAQRVVRRFIDRRKNDRVGLVVFGQGAMLQCPLTLDMDLLDRVVADLTLGDIPGYGTAIGDGLALGVAQLRRAEARDGKKNAKIVILLSDGDSNWVTRFNPNEAAALARKEGIKVFTVLIGRDDLFLFGGGSVNPQTLRDIASTTGGRFFRAEDEAELERSFRLVREQLDKNKRIKRERKLDAELAWPLLVLACGLLALEQLMARTRFRRLT